MPVLNKTINISKKTTVVTTTNLLCPPLTRGYVTSAYYPSALPLTTEFIVPVYPSTFNACYNNYYGRIPGYSFYSFAGFSSYNLVNVVIRFPGLGLKYSKTSNWFASAIPGYTINSYSYVTFAYDYTNTYAYINTRLSYQTTARVVFQFINKDNKNLISTYDFLSCQ